MIKRLFTLLPALMFVMTLLLPLYAVAQTGSSSDAFVPLTNLPGLTQTVNSDTLPTLFNNLYKLCIGAAAVIAILQIMRAGTYFFFNKGSVAHNEKAKGLIANSILGLVLVLSPAIIFGIINPDILNLRLNVGSLKPKATEEPTMPNAERVRYSSCSTQYEPIFAVSGTNQCDTVMGFVPLPESCYPGTSVPDTIYCGKPKDASVRPSQ